MIFVTGGCFQGKQQWVLQNCQVQPFRVGRWGSLQYGSNQKCRCTGSFSFAGAPLDAGRQNPADETEKILSDNPDIVIITDEIGSGIVPLDVKEREWREVHGRICCQLAGRADAVFRVIAGIGQKIK